MCVCEREKEESGRERREREREREREKERREKETVINECCHRSDTVFELARCCFVIGSDLSVWRALLMLRESCHL